MARLLAERLEEEGESAGAEISVDGLLEEWVPYGVARSSLELTTKSEYDLLVLEFLADRRLTVLGDPAVAEAAAEELETPEPGLEPLEEHADVALRLDLATISGGYRGSEVEAGAEAGGPVSGGQGPEDPASGTDGEDDGDASGAVEAWDPTGGVDARPTVDAGGDSESGPESDAECRSCGEPLPVDVDVPVRFCPSCGAARPERACPECGARLRPEWSYCPACGTHASPSGGVSESGPEGVDAGEWEPE